MTVRTRTTLTRRPPIRRHGDLRIQGHVVRIEGVVKRGCHVGRQLNPLVNGHHRSIHRDGARSQRRSRGKRESTQRRGQRRRLGLRHFVGRAGCDLDRQPHRLARGQFATDGCAPKQFIARVAKLAGVLQAQADSFGLDPDGGSVSRRPDQGAFENPPGFRPENDPADRFSRKRFP